MHFFYEWNKYFYEQNQYFYEQKQFNAHANKHENTTQPKPQPELKKLGCAQNSS